MDYFPKKPLWTGVYNGDLSVCCDAGSKFLCRFTSGFAQKSMQSRGIKVAAPPLDSPCDGPVTCPGDGKVLVKSSKGRSGPTLNTTTFLLKKHKVRIIT